MEKQQFMKWAKNGNTPRCIFMTCADGQTYALDVEMDGKLQAITDSSGHVLTFASLEQAQDFLRKCNIHEAELRLSVAHDEMIGEPIKSGSEAEQTMPLKF